MMSRGLWGFLEARAVQQGGHSLKLRKPAIMQARTQAVVSDPARMFHRLSMVCPLVVFAGNEKLFENQLKIGIGNGDFDLRQVRRKHI
jgi:hypothetical protein